MKIKKIIISFVVFLLSIVSTTAQGWQKTYEANDTLLSPPKGKSVVQTIDGGYLAVGSTQSNLTPGGPMGFVLKVDANGTEQWRNTLWGNGITKVLNTTDGHNLLARTVVHTSQQSPVTLDTVIVNIWKMDDAGGTLWSQSYRFNNTLLQNSLNYSLTASLGDVINTSDGGYVFTVIKNDSTLLAKINAQGLLQWYKQIANDAQLDGLTETSTNEFIIVGNNSFNVTKPKVVKTDAQGNVLWQKDSVGQAFRLECVTEAPDGNYIVGGVINMGAGDFPLVYKIDTAGNQMSWGQLDIQDFNSPLTSATVSSIKVTPNGDFIIAGSENLYANHIGYLAKLDVNGQVIQTNTFNQLTNTHGVEVQVTSNGGCVVVGANSSGLYLAKTDSSLQFPKNTIRGNVFADLNANCQKDSLENNMGNWIIEVTGNVQGLVQTIYATSDTNGNYAVDVETGNYLVAITPASAYWQACQDSQTVVFNQYHQDTVVDFSLQNMFSCPLLQVDIAAPFLRRCFNSVYHVNYTNWGGSTAQNAYVEVELDSFLIYNSSSIPLVSQTGRIFRFDIGNVAIGQSGTFQINVTVDCNTTILGQTHCTEAHIYPDSICIPNYWNGPIIQANAVCLGDSVRFDLNNTGTTLVSNTSYVIIEDHIIVMHSNNLSINAGGQTSITYPAQQGSTYRIIVDQAAGFPVLLGDTFATAAIEGCNPLSNGSFNIGLITTLSNGNASPFIAVDCQQNRASYDPNDKQAQPEGYGTPHYINDNTDLDYKIRFQNTGTDTAFTVVIRDTLSSYLNINSIEMGASSHPYTWRIYGQGVLEITFSNIMLPDSNVNEPASHGFVRYRIQQKEGNATGTVIYNAADIYFDFNPAIRTNQTWHTIGSDFITVLSVDKLYMEGVEVMIYPNPFTQSTKIEVKNEVYETLRLSIYDISGKEIRQEEAFYDNQIELHRGNLQAGVYFYRLIGDKQMLSSGKIIVR